MPAAKSQSKTKKPVTSSRKAKAAPRLPKWSLESAQLDAVRRIQPFVEFEVDGTVIGANDLFLKTMGFTIEEIQGKNHSMFVDAVEVNTPEYREFWNRLVRGEDQACEVRRIDKGGKTVWLQASYSPIKNQKGQVVKIVKFATDITNQKRDTAMSARLRMALEGCTSNMMVADANHNIIFINEALKSFLSEAERDIQKDLPNFSVASLLGSNMDVFHKNPAHQRNVVGKMSGTIKTSIQVAGRAYNLVATPIMGANYERLGTVVEWMDGSAAGFAEALNKSQAIIEFSLDGTIRFANENFLATLGYTLDQIKGKHHSMFVDPTEAASPVYRQFWDDLRAGKFQSNQFKRFGQGGKEIWIQASYNPIFDLNGRPIKVVKTASDITKAKQMEFEIAEAQKRDAKATAEMQQKVSEILAVAQKVSQKDYSQTLTVCGSDSIGQLGEGLTKFFENKRQGELQEEERANRERQQAVDLQRKVSVVLEIVNAVAEGNFDVEFPNLGDDAIGQVASALQVAVNSMKEALLEVRNVAETVSSAAEQLTKVSQEITTGAQTQASSLEETASSLEEITSTVKQNTDNAQQARQLATGSRDVAEKGGQVVDDAVQAMGEINKSSKQIADIITTIDEIAFQTNLLALNAAVEAARAGEQGRGFAVVAAEVRNLAQRSASAAKEIKSLIQDSVRKVENGSDLVNKSGMTLSEIVNSVKRVTDIVAEIAAASKEQLTGIEQVNKAVSQMDRVTQANAAQTEEMSGTASALLSNAIQLSQLVARFRLDSDDAAVVTKKSSSQNGKALAKRKPQATKPRRATSIELETVGADSDASDGVMEF